MLVPVHETKLNWLAECRVANDLGVFAARVTENR